MRCVLLIPREIASKPRNMPVIEISRPMKPENTKTRVIKMRMMNDIVLV